MRRPNEQRAFHRERPLARRMRLSFRTIEPATASIGNQHEKAPEEHRGPQSQIIKGGIGGKAREGAAVVSGSRGERRRGFPRDHGARCWPARQALRGSSEDQAVKPSIESAITMMREHDVLDLAPFDLLAEVFRRPPHHEARDEDGEQDEHHHAVQTRAYAAEDDFTELNVDEGHQAAHGSETVVHGVDSAAGSIGRDRGEQRRIENSESRFLSFHVRA